MAQVFRHWNRAGVLSAVHSSTNTIATRAAVMPNPPIRSAMKLGRNGNSNRNRWNATAGRGNSRYQPKNSGRL
jgi:hypothetical protein